MPQDRPLIADIEVLIPAQHAWMGWLMRFLLLHRQHPAHHRTRGGVTLRRLAARSPLSVVNFAAERLRLIRNCVDPLIFRALLDLPPDFINTPCCVAIELNPAPLSHSPTPTDSSSEADKFMIKLTRLLGTSLVLRDTIPTTLPLTAELLSPAALEVAKLGVIASCLCRSSTLSDAIFSQSVLEKMYGAAEQRGAAASEVQPGAQRQGDPSPAGH
ncbi:MAG: hypothetical protein WDW38_000066 [Sanguina aurantia]